MKYALCIDYKTLPSKNLGAGLDYSILEAKNLIEAMSEADRIDEQWTPD